MGTEQPQAQHWLASFPIRPLYPQVSALMGCRAVYRSKSPARTASRNADHSACLKVSGAWPGFLESRTCTAAAVVAVSTQAPVEQRDERRQVSLLGFTA